jgi:pimeloyl-ACP methyl ester carboxylesterase
MIDPPPRSERREHDTRAGRVTVALSGEGPLVLLVPAAGRAAADFEPVVPALARHFRVAAMDWPSHGASPPAPAPAAATAASLVPVLGDVLDALGGEPAVLIGHSVGGFAAARLAIDAPERARALVIVDALGFTRFGRLQRAFCAAKGVAAVTRATEGVIARVQTLRRNPHTARIFARVDEARRRGDYSALTAALWRSFPDPANDLRRDAAAIRCPTLICWGRLDPVIPVSGARTAARLIPGAELALFLTGHTPFAEDPAGFLRAVEGFLDRNVRARAVA